MGTSSVPSSKTYMGYSGLSKTCSFVSTLDSSIYSILVSSGIGYSTTGYTWTYSTAY